uniref:TauD/TfdA family dioxygenase n=1 Tax=Nonomuraea bangladeshensis TaxID=404385 RepID=UPI003F49B17E
MVARPPHRRRPRQLLPQTAVHAAPRRRSVHRLRAGLPAFGAARRLRAGDLQLLNNHVVLHSRTEYTDHPEPERRRHLLRLWLTT